MSLAGPVLSIQPSVVVSTSLSAMQSPVQNSSPLLTTPVRRERANSANDVLAIVDKTAPPSPLILFDQTQSLNAPAGSLSPISRSRSIPRGAISEGSSLSVASSSLRGPSPRLSKRAQTIDTPKIYREEFEDHTQLNQYKVLDIIGHGSYGIVRKAMSMDTDETYAMKIVGKGRLKKKGALGRPPRGGAKRTVKNPLDNIKREIAILKKLNHPNVVRLFEVLDDPSEDDLILVFEFIPNGPVMDKLPMDNPFTEEESRNYFVDMILGVEYLHSQHVIHRDIKPMNLLLNNEFRIKIADFGVSEEIERTESNLSRWAGTPAFVAPECLDGSKVSFQGQPVDIWAAGITLFCFVLGKVPWSPPAIVDLYEQIKVEDPPLPDSLPPDLADLLKQLLDKDQKKRITIPNIRKHPWVLKSSRIVPSQEGNCNTEINVSEEDVEQAVKTYHTPIHILAMIKQMAKKRSLRRPFSPKSPATSPAASPAPSPKRLPDSSSGDGESAKSTKTKNSIRKRENFAHSHNAPPIIVDNVDAET